MNLLAVTSPIVKQLPAENSERELAARLARGEPGALEAAIEQYGQRVTGLSVRATREGSVRVGRSIRYAPSPVARAKRGKRRKP